MGATVNIVKSTYCDLVNMHGGATLIGSFVAGEAIATGVTPVALHSDGKIYKAISTAHARATYFADYLGVVRKPVASGAVGAVYGKGSKFNVAVATETPNTYVTISDTAGALAVGESVHTNSLPYAIGVMVSSSVMLLI